MSKLRQQRQPPSHNVTQPDGRIRSTHLRWHVFLLAFYLLATLALTWPLLTQIGSAIPGDSFDGWQNYWNLWWVKIALLEQHTHPYFSDALYHPTGVSLWFQTINIFNGLSSLPVQLAGNLFWAYNAIVLFSFTMAGYGAALLALSVLHRSGARVGWPLWAGAALAGVIFTFSPFHFAHLLGHMQVFSLTFIPYYVLYLVRAMPANDRKLHWRDAGMAALFLILAALCDWYFGLYLALFTLLYLLWMVARRYFKPVHILALAIIFSATLLLTAPLLVPMVKESLRYDFMRPPPGQIIELSADIFSFLIPSSQHSVWGTWAGQLRAGLPASPSENTLYIGLIPLLLALYALFQRCLKLTFWAIAAAVFIIFSFGPVLHIGGNIVTLPNGQALPMPYSLVLLLPFIEIARTVARYDLLVMMCVGVLAGGGLYSLLSVRTRKWLAVLAIALVLLDFSPIPYPLSPPDTPPWYSTLAEEEPSGAVLNVPMDWDRPGYLLYQTVHAKPLTAGYISRTDPRTYPTRIPILSDFRHLGPDINAVDVSDYAATIFAFADVQWVVADRYKMPEGNTRTITEGLMEELFQGRTPVYEDERLTVYDTWPDDGGKPFIEIGTDWGERLPGPRRLIVDQASFIVHSPDGASLLFKVTPADDGQISSLWLEDAQGQVVDSRPGNDGHWLLDLSPGPNPFTLHTDKPGVYIQKLELETANQ